MKYFSPLISSFIVRRLHLSGANSDILLALDNHQSVILLLFDLSAAFDTVDDEILLNRLNHRFGTSDLPLSWFK